MDVFELRRQLIEEYGSYAASFIHRVFRIKSEEGEHRRLRLHRHQADAIDAARAGANYVLTTGTGSGKSLTYVVPMDAVLNRAAAWGSGHLASNTKR